MFGNVCTHNHSFVYSAYQPPYSRTVTHMRAYYSTTNLRAGYSISLALLQISALIIFSSSYLDALQVSPRSPFLTLCHSDKVTPNRRWYFPIRNISADSHAYILPTPPPAAFRKAITSFVRCDRPRHSNVHLVNLINHTSFSVSFIKAYLYPLFVHQYYL